jgi:Tfp pilus assembly PilM family ATPase
VYERGLPDAGLAPLRARFAKAIALEPEFAETIFAQITSPGAEPADDLPSETTAALDEHAQVLVQELRTALTYAIHRYGGEVSKVLLQGCGANLRGLGERLTAELGAPVAPARPSDLLACAPGVAADDTGLSVAIGLALHDFRRAA